MSGNRRVFGRAVATALTAYVALVGVAAAQQSADSALWDALMDRVRAEKLQQQQTHEQQIRQAGLELDHWYCAGPFRDGGFGLFSRCFAKAYGPERDATKAGVEPVDLRKTYDRGRVRWVEHPEWVDGFFHPLPIGSAPARNESVYLYRTITSKMEMRADAHVVAEDAIRVWVNGKMVGQGGRVAGGRFKRFLDVELPLQPGENRLLVKVTSLFARHGFSFAIPRITRSSDFRVTTGTGTGGLSAPLQSAANRFLPGNEPFASASRRRANDVAQSAESRPAGYVLKDTWQETILASGKVETKHDLWELLAADFPGEDARREIFWERDDGIWRGILPRDGKSAVSIDHVRVAALGEGNLVVNGSFEPHGKPGQSDYFPDAGSGHLTIAPGTTIGGWTQASGGAAGELLGTGYEAHGGRQSYHLGGGHGAGSVSQSFDTAAGKEYFVSFQAAGFPGDDDLKMGTISVGNLNATYRTAAGTGTATDMGWAEHGFFFTAVDAKSTLMFGSPEGKSGTITIDDVRVVPVLGDNLIAGGDFKRPAVSHAGDGETAKKLGQARLANPVSPALPDVGREPVPLLHSLGKGRTFATKPGQTYGLVFRSSGHHHRSLDDVQTGFVSVGSSNVHFTTPKAADATELRWTPQGYVFTAVDSTSTVTFGESHSASVFFDRYVGATLRLLELPETARSLFPKTRDAADVRTVRNVYHRARQYTSALARAGEFHFDVGAIPMYGPPRLKMAEILDGTGAPSQGGQAHLDRLAALKTRAHKALAGLQRGQPGAAGVVIEVAGDIEKTWSEAIRSLGPIAFIKRPMITVNAVSPYQAGGGSPSSICVFDPAKPDEPPRVIYDDPGGAVFDMNLSYDAKTIFFSARRRGVEGGWHIYEIGVDGQGLKRITGGPGSDISPLELPSGEIMFVSARAGNMLVCQARPAGCLYVANRDGSNVRRVSGNTLSDHTPQIMNDGRVLFTRWDYGVDKGVFSRHALWVMNPNGTHLRLFFGNTIEDPCAFWEARPVPGRPEVVCTFGPHHSYQAGMIGLLWNGMGPEARRGEGFRWVSQELPVVCDISFPWGYQDPYPINERMFLVSYGGDGEHRNRIYLPEAPPCRPAANLYVDRRQRSLLRRVPLYGWQRSRGARPLVCRQERQVVSKRVLARFPSALLRVSCAHGRHLAIVARRDQHDSDQQILDRPVLDVARVCRLGSPHCPVRPRASD